MTEGLLLQDAHTKVMKAGDHRGWKLDADGYVLFVEDVREIVGDALRDIEVELGRKRAQA